MPTFSDRLKLRRGNIIMRTKKAKTAAIFFTYIGGKINTQTNYRILQ
jgi:hypothetical protein